MENSHLKRINELAHKAKTIGLTEEEIKERDEERKAYIKEFRAGFTDILNNTSVQMPDGSRVKLQKKK